MITFLKLNILEFKHNIEERTAEHSILLSHAWFTSHIYTISVNSATLYSKLVCSLNPVFAQNCYVYCSVVAGIGSLK